MNLKRKQESAGIGFSYLDVFFLILAGLILSLWVYIATSEGDAAIQGSSRVELTASYEAALIHALPQEGQDLFDEKGNRIGRVESVLQYEAENQTVGSAQIYLICTVDRTDLKEGDLFPVETAFSVKIGKIVHVEILERGEKKQ